MDCLAQNFLTHKKIKLLLVSTIFGFLSTKEAFLIAIGGKQRKEGSWQKESDKKSNTYCVLADLKDTGENL